VRIVNPSRFNKTFTPVLPLGMVDSIAVTRVSPHATMVLQSDGVNWRQIDGPVGDQYLGNGAGNPTVRVGNFDLRFNTAGIDLQIASVVGAETIHAFTNTLFGSGAGQADISYVNLALTAGVFVNFGDPDLTVDNELRRYVWFRSPAAAGEAGYVLDVLCKSTAPRALIMRAGVL
jgi:hypothetical protein